MACAACIVAAATLPWAGSAAEKLATEDMRLAAITDIDAFSGIPYYIDILSGAFGTGAAGLDSINGIPPLLAFLGGDIDALADYDALSAVPVFFGTNGVFNGGGVDALANYDALSAVPSYVALAQASSADDVIDALGGIDAFSALPVFRDIGAAAAAGNFASTCTTNMGVVQCTSSVASALGDYAALSAVDTFFGDGPIGADGVTPIGGVFTGGGIDALAPDADGNGGYAALSALPVFFGPDTSGNAPFGPGVFAGGGIDALANYDALSAIPAYLNPAPTTTAATTFAAPEAKVAEDPAPTAKTTFVAAIPKPKEFTPPAPRVFTPPAPPQEKPKVEPAAAVDPDDGGQNLQNVTRDSENFSTRKKLGDDPFLFGSGNKGPDNGIRGWGDMLKKAGIGGGADTEGAGAGSGTE